MEFSQRQQELIHAMIQLESESIRDFYGDGPGYDIFLHNHLITPDKEIVINNILNFANTMEFSNEQLQLIYTMIEQHSESIRDYCNVNSLNYNDFLKKHNITLIEEIVINSILKQAYNMEFSNEQLQLIDTTIEQHSESIRDYCHVNSIDDDSFLQNYQITPSKEIIINNILKNARDLNPYTSEGFNKPELQKIKNNFDTNKPKLRKLKRDFQTYKRELSYIQPRPSSHTMATRSNTKRKRSRGKTKKKKKKNKKKKRKSYKK